MHTSPNNLLSVDPVALFAPEEIGVFGVLPDPDVLSPAHKTTAEARKEGRIKMRQVKERSNGCVLQCTSTNLILFGQ